MWAIIYASTCGTAFIRKIFSFSAAPLICSKFCFLHRTISFLTAFGYLTTANYILLSVMWIKPWESFFFLFFLRGIPFHLQRVTKIALLSWLLRAGLGLVLFNPVNQKTAACVRPAPQEAHVSVFGLAVALSYAGQIKLEIQQAYLNMLVCLFTMYVCR